jgi:HEAT repeat protein
MTDTPTFQERPANDRLDIDQTCDRLERGDVSRDVLRSLDDLSRAADAELRTRWASFPPEARERLTREAVELAEADVSFEFGRLFRTALADASPTVRQLAVSGLWEDERGDVVDLLLSVATDDPDVDVKAEALSNLGHRAELAAHGRLDDQRAARIRALVAALAADPTTPPVMRRRAVEAFGAFGADEETTRVLTAMHDDDDTAMRASAIYGMGRTESQQWAGVVLSELGSPDPELRFEAARAAGRIGIDAAVTRLGDLATDEDPEVRFAAIGALGAIGGKEAIQRLRALREGAPESDRAEIDAALDEAMLLDDLPRAQP